MTERWGQYVDRESLQYFAPFESDYEVRFHLNLIRYGPAETGPLSTLLLNSRAALLPAHADRFRRERLNGNAGTGGPSPARLRNRRYRALQHLEAAGEYFSMDEMRERQPALYNEYIGQYDAGGNEEEEEEEGEGSEQEENDDGAYTSELVVQRPRRSRPNETTKLSELLLRHYDDARLRHQAVAAGAAFLARPPPMQEEQIVEYDSDDERAVADAARRQQGRDAVIDVPPRVLSPASRAELRQEYITLMKQRFLAGLDVCTVAPGEWNADSY